MSQANSRGPWNFTTTSATGVYCYYGAQHGGDCAHAGKTNIDAATGKLDGTMFLEQNNIYIASGTTVLVSGYVRPTRGPANSNGPNGAPYVFTLNFAGTTVGTYSPTTKSAEVSDGSGSGYRQLTNTFVVSGDGPHTLSLQIRTKGTNNKFIYDADDFSVSVVAPPADRQLCATSSGSLDG